MKSFATFVALVLISAVARSQQPVTPPSPTSPTPVPSAVPPSPISPPTISPPPTGSGLLLPPPGSTPAPIITAGGPVSRLPTPDKANDEAFQKAATQEATQGIAVINGPTISLDEALRVTLYQQPSIKLSQEDIEIARGALQDAISAFDTHLTADVEHGQKVTPFTDDQILQQVKTREGLIKTLHAVQKAEGALKAGKQSTLSVTQTGGTTTLNASNVDPTTSQVFDLQTLIAEEASILDSSFNSTSTGSLVQQVQHVQNEAQKSQLKLLTQFEQQVAKELKDFQIATTARSTTTTYKVGLEKTLRNGIFVNPHIDYSKPGKDNTANMTLDVTVPLGQGRGGVALRAAEQAQYMDLLGSEMQLRHEISDALYRTATAYWNLLGAQQTYQVILQSSRVTDTFVSLTSKRKELGEAADAEVIKAQSRKAAVDLQILQALLAVLEARHALADAMGLYGKDLENPPYALGNIPTSMDISALRMDQLFTIGLKSITNRDDRRAVMQSMRSGKLLADAAFFEIKPRADLVFSLGASSVDTGSQGVHYFSPFTDNKVGATAKVSFQLDWPFEENAAKGLYLKSLGGYRQGQIKLFDIDRQVENNAILAAGQVMTSYRQVAAARRASDLALKSLEAERSRYNVGEGSLLDTLLIEEQLSTARQQEVSTRVAFINSVATLRFQSGTILTPDSGHTPATVSFSSFAFRSIPNWSSIPLPDPPPGVDTLWAGAKPKPLLKKIFGDRSEVKAHERAIEPKSYYQSMLDARNGGQPEARPPHGGKDPVPVMPAPASAPPPAKASADSAPPADGQAPPPRKKPKGWLQRLSE